MQTLDVISVNLWQMAASLLNLILLLLIVKKFLYKPVKKMLAERQSTIEGEYAEAEKAKAEALADKAAYAEKLDTAAAEADRVIKSAVDIAAQREREIIENAKDRADGIVRQAEVDAALEMKKAEESIRREIVEVSSVLTEKVLEREVTMDDHKQFIDSFIEGIGETDETN